MDVDGLANSASTRSRMKPSSISSSARNTSAGMIVRLPPSAVTSFALHWVGVSGKKDARRGGTEVEKLRTRWLDG